MNKITNKKDKISTSGKEKVVIKSVMGEKEVYRFE